MWLKATKIPAINKGRTTGNKIDLVLAFRHWPLVDENLKVRKTSELSRESLEKPCISMVNSSARHLPEVSPSSRPFSGSGAPGTAKLKSCTVRHWRVAKHAMGDAGAKVAGDVRDPALKKPQV